MDADREEAQRKATGMSEQDYRALKAAWESMSGEEDEDGEWELVMQFACRRLRSGMLVTWDCLPGMDYDNAVKRAAEGLRRVGVRRPMGTPGRSAGPGRTPPGNAPSLFGQCE